MSLEEKKNYPVLIKTSTIKDAGRGVFVTVDVAVDSIVCFYDGYDKPRDRMLSKIESDYNLGDRIIGYKEPKAQGGVAQIINDKSRPDFQNFPINDSLKAQLQFICIEFIKYNKTSEDCNVIDNKNYIFKSIKTIKKGDELFFYYGVSYWIEKDINVCSVELARALSVFNMIFTMVKLTKMPVVQKELSSSSLTTLELIKLKYIVDGFLVYRIFNELDILIKMFQIPSIDVVKRMRESGGIPKADVDVIKKQNELDHNQQFILQIYWNLYKKMYSLKVEDFINGINKFKL